jgi:hypothetical protein
MATPIKIYSPTLAVASIVHASQGTPYKAGSEWGPAGDFSVGLKRVFHFKYDFSIDGGAISTITLGTPGTSGPSIPSKAILLDVTLNPTTAPVGAGASIAFGVSAGGSTTTLKAVTAITSFTIDALLKGAMTPAAPVKMTAAGFPTMTISGATLTAGLVEGWIEFYVAANQ